MTDAADRPAEGSTAATPAGTSRRPDPAARWRGAVGGPFVAELLVGVGWSAGGAAIERLCSLLQAFYIARLLGIELFGKYGLLFTTIGLISSLAGLQLGLTAAVTVARDKFSAPDRAATVIRLCEIVSVALAMGAALAIAIAPVAAAQLLLGGAEHADVILAGAVIALLSVVAGVQEGVLQGFEEFSKLSLIRIVTALAGLAILFLAGRSGDLTSVIVALSAGIALRTVALLGFKEQTARRYGFKTTPASIWRARIVILDFSLPSVLATLVGGGAAWYGMFLLSGSPEGFKDVAVVTAGQQWRGLVLYLAAISASVAIPMMSRLHGGGDHEGVAHVHRLNLWVNVPVSIGVVLLIGLGSEYILAAYGGAFVGGAVPFWIIIATTVPAIYANVAMQLLVSQGRMWEQFGYYLLQSIPLAAGYYLIVGSHGALGYAVWTAIMGVLICFVLAARVRVNHDFGPEKHASNS